MTEYLSHRSVVTVLLLYLTVWLSMPTEFISLILARYDDGGEIYNTAVKRDANYVLSLLEILHCLKVFRLNCINLLQIIFCW